MALEINVNDLKCHGDAQSSANYFRAKLNGRNVATLPASLDLDLAG